MASLILAGKIMSLLLILFVGFLIVRLGILSSDDARVVSRLTIYAVTPCTIITSYQVSFTPDIRDALLVTLAAGVITQMFFTFISLFYPLQVPPRSEASCPLPPQAPALRYACSLRSVHRRKYYRCSFRERLR